MTDSATPDKVEAARLRGERRRHRTRAALLDAAEQLLSDRSADAVRMEDVAALAGISPASVYVHFGTKEALVTAVIERLLDMSMASLTAAYASEGSAFEQVQQAGLAYMRLLLDHPALTRHLSGAVLSEPQTPIDGTVVERIEFLRNVFEARIQAAVDAGEIVPVDSRLLSFFLFGAWQGVASLALRRDTLRLTPKEVERCLTQAIQVLVAGVTSFATD
ncbi:TetR/AcrR family transcriptional regulator [Rhodococcus tibetensis]|uniref:TetR/AcrR family transcriptional regulator n=1 Tax=Rhodococcus tibetensis TaxID=2965064 RepID=A0ABT1Q8V8_9NOCA|nr:TetR/AcrR family transcriptional regulator [Rhodococcus sp. FXJ9.536]MCQ4118138.1 TetR/AcrR family transcriptional regulator [Rhodococcus sp. FXJ9.536]